MILTNVVFSKLLIFLHIYRAKFQQTSLPLGVSLERSHLYKSNDGSFYCLSNSYEIPYSSLNDDYCDCADGSDEPGTSACNNGVYYCKNKGYHGKYINSSWLNDGICDCCDGSDEYNHFTKCPNTCEIEGKAFVEKIQKEIMINEAGLKVKQGYIEEGQKGRRERQEKLSKITQDLDALEQEKKHFEQIMKDMESQETDLKQAYQTQLQEIKEKLAAEEKLRKTQTLFQKLDSDGNGRLTIEEFSANLPALPDSSDQINECDADLDGNFNMQDLLAKFRDLEKSEVNVEVFFQNLTDILDKCHPDAFKEEIPESAPAIAPEVTTESPTTTPDIGPEGDELVAEGEEKPYEANAADLEEEVDEADEDDDDQSQDDLLPRDKHAEGGDWSSRGGTVHHVSPPRESADPLLPYSPEMEEIMRKTETAQKDFREIESKWQSIKSQYASMKRVDELDLGPELEFAALVDQCYELDDHDYIYKICPFKNVVQRSKDSSSETVIGNWQSFEAYGEDRYAFMKFDNGQQCWNGPKRSTKVKIDCGSDNKVLSVSEPSRCEYYLEFTTPAKCKPIDQRPELKAYFETFRDEL